MLKQGTKLVRKDTGEEYHIGGVCGEVYFIVYTETGDTSGFFTEKGINEYYTIIGEKWEPQDGEKYWFVDTGGYVDWTTWNGDSADLFRSDYLGIYKTKEEAQTARGNMKKIN